MLRRAFVRRMAFAAAACAFLDVPLPSFGQVGSDVVGISEATWRDVSFRDTFGREASVSLDGSAPCDFEVGKSYTLDWVEDEQVSEHMPGMVCIGIVESRADGVSRAVSAA